MAKSSCSPPWPSAPFLPFLPFFLFFSFSALVISFMSKWSTWAPPFSSAMRSSSCAFCAAFSASSCSLAARFLSRSSLRIDDLVCWTGSEVKKGSLKPRSSAASSTCSSWTASGSAPSLLARVAALFLSLRSFSLRLYFSMVVSSVASFSGFPERAGANVICISPTGPDFADFAAGSSLRPSAARILRLASSFLLSGASSAS